MKTLIALIAIVAAQAVHAADEPAARAGVAENPYAKSFVAQSKVAQKAEPGELKIYRGRDKVADYQRQLEKGYEILGYSSFEGGEVSPDLLAGHAASIHADVVLVYTGVSASMPKSVRMARARAEQEGKVSGSEEQGDGTVYSYFASYWSKMPPPILGVNVRGKGESQDGKTGLVVLAVIEQSPAAAVLRSDDLLLQLGDVALDKPEALVPAARRYAGQTVEIAFERSGELMRAPLTLGPLR